MRVLEIIGAERGCESYTPWQMGYGPREHVGMSSQIARESEPNQVYPRKVFVVFGRNERIRRSMFSFLRALRLEPIEWAEAVRMTGAGTPYVGDVLDVAVAKAQAIVIVMTPDDEGKLRNEFFAEDDPEHEKKLTPQARQNVVFETGLALGRQPGRTILVEIGSLRPFSDIIGRHTVRLNNGSQARHSLAERLRTAGCELDTTGTDWLTEGDFQADAIDGRYAADGTQTPGSKPLQPGTKVVDRIERTGTRLPPVNNRTVYIDTENGVPFQEGEIGTLKLLADAGNIVNVVSIANSLGILRQVAQHYLDNLKEKEYVTYSIAGYDGQPPGYSLTPKGRSYLFQAGRL